MTKVASAVPAAATTGMARAALLRAGVVVRSVLITLTVLVLINKIRAVGSAFSRMPTIGRAVGMLRTLSCRDGTRV